MMKINSFAQISRFIFASNESFFPCLSEQFYHAMILFSICPILIEYLAKLCENLSISRPKLYLSVNPYKLTSDEAN